MPSFGFLSTHPPTRCGLATFNSALAGHLTADGTPGGVVRVIDGGAEPVTTPGVVHTWSTRTRGCWRAAAAALDQFDVAIVQHEYGIYPGADGEEVLPLLRRLTVPSIVVLHTVLADPTERQRSLLTQIAGAAGAVVVMTRTARDRLLDGYGIDPATVSVIPHGAPVPAGGEKTRRARPHLLTWGLIGPGKGIEWALRALALLQDLDPVPTYTVAGRTHPKVIEYHGEAYRAGLHQLAAELGVGHTVDFQQVYHDQAALAALIRSADVVVLPYDSREQVTSGVLIEAVAAGVPVVATPFPHAIELLADGPGLIVPHRDPKALAAAIRGLLTVPGLAAGVVGRTGPGGADLSWPAVADSYRALAARLLAARTRVDVAVA